MDYHPASDPRAPRQHGSDPRGQKTPPEVRRVPPAARPPVRRPMEGSVPSARQQRPPEPSRPQPAPPRPAPSNHAGNQQPPRPRTAAPPPFSPMRPANNQSAGKGERYPRPGEAYTPSYAPPQAARSHAPVDSGRHGSTGGSRPPGKGSRAGGGAGKSKSVPRWILIVLDILIVAVICAGIYFLAVPKIVEWKAEKLKQQILEDLKKNPDQAVQVKIPRGYGAVPGEDYEDGFGTVFVGNDADQLTNDEEVTLTYVGRMVIPKIGVSTPVSNDHSLPALRFGVGILTWEEAAALPDPGLTTIFGHRYITKGRDFNRLDEIRVGDTFFIDYNPTGTRYHYEVDNTMIIPAEELQAHVVEPWNEKKLMLVTCHPITYLSMTERILVYAHPTREEPIPK